ncbi:hypothetical protein DAPPUDRAFT_313372 [Daphnia pulex]|uniref:Kinesin motor domain-containing protein n=1 Tax=Daphnia pulex TaxID=6669 RepID=E9G2M7_DAPPU|nr:hypothetical protein DAPPUDRAFT_313372 [Daphnia pulex]|eukprot:EFX86286.1 hypothetical protein DAPPUDRAFT_313372 [Daphnia pulex]
MWPFSTQVEEVKNDQQLRNLVVMAQQEQLAVASISCNEHPSRSHSAVQLKLTGLNAGTNETSKGVVYMVDLAGAESVDKSGATGDRLTEQALGGSAKTLMFIILSPNKNCIKETVNALQMAAKANACEIGTAMKNRIFSFG